MGQGGVILQTSENMGLLTKLSFLVLYTYPFLSFSFVNNHCFNSSHKPYANLLYMCCCTVETLKCIELALLEFFIVLMRSTLNRSRSIYMQLCLYLIVTKTSLSVFYELKVYELTRSFSSSQEENLEIKRLRTDQPSDFVFYQLL